jgi:hypothetical protein
MRPCRRYKGHYMREGKVVDFDQHLHCVSLPFHHAAQGPRALVPLKVDHNADLADVSRRPNALIFPITVATHAWRGRHIS